MTNPLAEFFLSHAPSQRYWRSFAPGEARASVPYRWQPSANLYEVEDGVVVRMDVAGLREGDFRVRLVDGRIVVDGLRRERPPRSILACHQVEIASGRFRSEIALPWAVEPDDLEVEYADGMIEIFVPRRRDASRDR
ncbi:MAG: Hsp20/alpha crystallin family protein [Anaerolineae bacterium]|jgi:HSP20 family protein